MHRLLVTLVLATVLLALIACGDGGSGEESFPQVLIGGPTGPATPTPGALGASATPDATAVAGPASTPTVVSLDWLDGNTQVPALPPFAAARSDAGLAAAIQSSITGAPGRTSVVVHNLQDGRYAAVNENEVYYAASLFKMGILLEAYQQRDAGTLDFAKQLTLEQKYVDLDLGTLEELGLKAGDLITVADAARAMIVVSDTPSAVLLQDTLGCTVADQTLVALGITRTEFCNRDLPATAADMTTLIEAVASGAGVSDASRLEMLSLLSQEYYRKGVFAGVPSGTPIAHKTGHYPSATHDVALVWGPAGPYVITVMTDQPLNWGTIAAISSAVWGYFAANPA
jgi:beta-lactamase class A